VPSCFPIGQRIQQGRRVSDHEPDSYFIQNAIELADHRHRLQAKMQCKALDVFHHGSRCDTSIVSHWLLLNYNAKHAAEAWGFFPCGARSSANGFHLADLLAVKRFF
jgi:hypothetical protein